MEKINMDCTWGTQNLNPKFSVRANNDQAQSIGLDWSTEVDGCFSFVLFLCFIFLRWENIVMTTNAALQSVYSVSCIPVSGFKVPALKADHQHINNERVVFKTKFTRVSANIIWLSTGLWQSCITFASASLTAYRWAYLYSALPKAAVFCSWEVSR